MVNVYTEYIKELFDYVHGLFLASDGSVSVRFEYRFDEYPPKVSQQQALLDKLEQTEVFKVVSRIDLPPAKEIELGIHGNEYSATGCAGYVLEVDKEVFNKYRSTTKALKSTEEHVYGTPHLSDDGRILYVNDVAIDLDTSAKHKELLTLIFDDTITYSCTEKDFAATGNENARANPAKYANDTVYYLNKKIELKTGIPDFLKRANKGISLNPRFFD